jgi:hypothetical protein
MCPLAQTTCTRSPRPTASRGCPCMPAAAPAVIEVQATCMQRAVWAVASGCPPCTYMHQGCRLARGSSSLNLRVCLPCSWSPPSGQTAYSSSNSVDDMALAATWRCKRGVTGSCAEATSQLDRALADGSVYWTPVGWLVGWCAGCNGSQACGALGCGGIAASVNLVAWACIPAPFQLHLPWFDAGVRHPWLVQCGTHGSTAASQHQGAQQSPGRGIQDLPEPVHDPLEEHCSQVPQHRVGLLHAQGPGAVPVWWRWQPALGGRRRLPGPGLRRPH